VGLREEEAASAFRPLATAFFPNLLMRYVFLTRNTNCRTLQGHRPRKVFRIDSERLQASFSADTEYLGGLSIPRATRAAQLAAMEPPCFALFNKAC
jgi:hypothetical protein